MALAPLKARYTDLVEFFQWWIPEYLPDANLYLIGQSAPRPDNPYISFNPLADVDTVGTDELRYDDTDEYLRGQRKITCSVYGFSDSSTRFDEDPNAWEMLQELRFSLTYPAVREQLTAITCRVLEEGVVTNTSSTTNTSNEPRAQWEFVLSTVIDQSVAGEYGEITSSNSEGTVSEISLDVSV